MMTQAHGVPPAYSMGELISRVAREVNFFQLLWPIRLSEEHLNGLLGDVNLQIYKYYNAQRGQIKQLNSSYALVSNMVLNVTRDIEGNLLIVLQQNQAQGIVRKSISLNSQSEPSIADWHPVEALKASAQNIDSESRREMPAHLKEYFSSYEEFKNYLDKVYKESDTLQRDVEAGGKHIFPSGNPDGNKDIYVIRTPSGEYRVLLKTANPNEPFIQLNATDKIVFFEYGNAFVDKASLDFLKRVNDALIRVRNEPLPEHISEQIEKIQLIQCYQYILSNKVLLKQLVDGEGIRLDKRFHEDLPFTMNIVREPNDELALILESKRRGKKEVIGQGGFGVVKNALRIDGPSFQDWDWANKSSVGGHVVEADKEIALSQSISRDSRGPLNVTLSGPLFMSLKSRKIKRSQYSRRAVGNLRNLLKGQIYPPLTQKDKERIEQDTLEALSLMHKQGKIHQDIKLENILIYRAKDSSGNIYYYAKLADFGLSVDTNFPNDIRSTATSSYESPELLHSVCESTDERRKAYFLGIYGAHHSYALKRYEQLNMGSSLGEPTQYEHPDPKNDMWALGILLYELYNGGRVPQSEADINRSPRLIKGLLEIDREKRFDIDGALNVLRDIERDKIDKERKEKEKWMILLKDPVEVKDFILKSQRSLDLKKFLEEIKADPENLRLFCDAINNMENEEKFLIFDRMTLALRANRDLTSFFKGHSNLFKMYQEYMKISLVQEMLSSINFNYKSINYEIKGLFNYILNTHDVRDIESFIENLKNYPDIQKEFKDYVIGLKQSEQMNIITRMANAGVSFDSFLETFPDFKETCDNASINAKLWHLAPWDIFPDAVIEKNNVNDTLNFMIDYIIKEKDMVVFKRVMTNQATRQIFCDHLRKLDEAKSSQFVGAPFKSFDSK